MQNLTHCVKDHTIIFHLAELCNHVHKLAFANGKDIKVVCGYFFLYYVHHYNSSFSTNIATVYLTHSSLGHFR